MQSDQKLFSMDTYTQQSISNYKYDSEVHDGIWACKARGLLFINQKIRFHVFIHFCTSQVSVKQVLMHCIMREVSEKLQNSY